MNFDNPFHEGELEVQKLACGRAEGESNSAMISGQMMAGVFGFLRQQSFAVLSSRDERGKRWASIVFGDPGFLDPIDRKTLRIKISPQTLQNGDPVWKNIEHEPRIGILVIDLATRRRVRINGPTKQADDGLLVEVEESYPNCPKYITRRELHVSPDGTLPRSKPKEGTALTAAQTKLWKRTDLFFLATGHPERGADASHRGGNPGFVEVVDSNTLRFPDYPGNSLYNSLGNLQVDPHAGIVVPDFEKGIALQLTGLARIVWNVPDPDDHTGGTRRFVEFTLDEWKQRALGAQVQSTAAEYSPFNPR